MQMLDERNVKLVSKSGIKLPENAASANEPEQAPPALTWTPDNTNLAAVRSLNQNNLKATPDKATLPVTVGGAVVLIGAGHAKEAVDYVTKRPDKETGELTVRKAGAFSKGTIAVRGIGAKKPIVESAIGEISDKTVTFS